MNYTGKLITQRGIVLIKSFAQIRLSTTGPYPGYFLGWSHNPLFSHFRFSLPSYRLLSSVEYLGFEKYGVVWSYFLNHIRLFVVIMLAVIKIKLPKASL